MEIIHSKTRLYQHDQFDLQSMKLLPGFIYMKNTSGQYMWANHYLNKLATGEDSTSAIKGSTDHDFHWSEFADEMLDNDHHVITKNISMHTIENSQGKEGNLKNLVTYKFPLYDQNTLLGIIGFSYELPCDTDEKQLTDREQSCIALLAKGLSDKKIAKILSISARTVETHINKAKFKLNVNSRAELIVKHVLG